MNVTMTPSLHVGAKLVIMPKFEPKAFSQAIIKHKVSCYTFLLNKIIHYLLILQPTFMHLAPPLVSFVATTPDLTADHLKSLDHIVVAAAPSGPALIKKFKDKAPHCVYREAWGMTETGPIVHMTSLKDECNGSCGYLVPNTDAKVVDVNTGQALGPNERGELCCRGPQVSQLLQIHHHVNGIS